jgi:predicted Rossmann fold nucleotide-binding protein DprA/Smf involved in DNA uptake
LALIRDGATLARNAQDVLEALGRMTLVARPAARAVARDPIAQAVLEALDAGATDVDEIVAASGIVPSAALSMLALLELDGAVESQGGSRYARVAPPLHGEESLR